MRTQMETEPYRVDLGEPLPQSLEPKFMLTIYQKIRKEYEHTQRENQIPTFLYTLPPAVQMTKPAIHASVNSAVSHSYKQ